MNDYEFDRYYGGHGTPDYNPDMGDSPAESYEDYEAERADNMNDDRREG